MFEVGKKYKSGFVVAECVWKGKDKAILVDHNESVYTNYHKELGRGWIEYKEPRKCEGWVAIHEQVRSRPMMSYRTFASKEDALVSGNNVIDVIKVEWTEKSK